MSQNSTVFPGDLVSVLPQLDFAIIRTRGNKISCWMECDPVTSFFMTLQHFDTLYLDTDVTSRGLSLSKFLPEDGEIPNPNRRVQRARDYVVFLIMKLRAHHVMRMTRNDIDATPALIIPNPHGLIIGGRQNPRQFMMEVSGPDIVDMAL